MSQNRFSVYLPSFFTLLWLTLFTLGCDSSKPEAYQEAASTESAARTDQAGPAASTASPVQPQAKIIRNATLRFQVKDSGQSLQRIQAALKPFGAYLASSQSSRQDDYLETTMTIRVPETKLDALLAVLEKESMYLDFKNISSEDVSLEFVDISARLKTKKAVEARYLDLLQQARSIKDILQIENELRIIREEIESIQARLNYLNNQIAYSTITLTIYDNQAGRPAGHALGVRISNALAEGWDLFLSLCIGILYIWPLLLLIPLLVYVWRRLWRRFRPVR